MIRKVVLVVFALGAPFSAAAVNFSQADELFKNRGESFDVATHAREAYAQLLPDIQDEGLRTYALVQMGRLGVVRGMMFREIDRNKRRASLETCVADADQLPRASPEHFYFRIACLGLRAQLSRDTNDIVTWALKIRSTQKAALEATTQDGSLKGGFEGGGILRALSGIRASVKGQLIGLYNPQEGLDFARLALATESRTQAPFPLPMVGTEFFENFFYQGFANVNLGIQKDDKTFVTRGRTVLQRTINQLEGNESLITKYERETETRFYISLMKQLCDAIDSCLDGADWKSCLLTKIDEF